MSMTEHLTPVDYNEYPVPWWIIRAQSTTGHGNGRALVYCYSDWVERYGYYVDEMVYHVLNRLPHHVNGGHVVVWHPGALWQCLAKLCYDTSVNRFKKFKPIT